MELNDFALGGEMRRGAEERHQMDRRNHSSLSLRTNFKFLFFTIFEIRHRTVTEFLNKSSGTCFDHPQPITCPRGQGVGLEIQWAPPAQVRTLPLSLFNFDARWVSDINGMLRVFRKFDQFF